jgi:periplasmic protein TonB
LCVKVQTMTLRRAGARVVAGLIAALAFGAVPAGAQDTIARAKNLYQSADYDEALTVLDQLKKDPVAGASPEVAAYRVFCLLALGRSDEAHLGIGAILRLDPRYQPSESETSPRIRTVFDDERRRLLPQIFQERYDRAKASLERKEFQSAADQFKSLTALMDDPALAGQPSRADLRMVISGFSDLAQAALSAQAPPPAPPAPRPSPSPSSGAGPGAGPGVGPAAGPAAPAGAPSAVPPPAKPAVPAPAVDTRIYAANDIDVVPPVAVSKKMPLWRPPAGTVLWHEYVGMLEVVVDERGNVTSAAFRTSVHPLFDANVVQAARYWKFRPASRQGQPVRYRALIEVKLVP